ncbi:MAG: hypothetical protein IKO41_12610 [Lachnospiraceae bacterium]|nr:hypothetical protein [Desulfovibrio sp.]MBR4607049.1 hypothetical protein [Lachnospiraceae bacterium]
MKNIVFSLLIAAVLSIAVSPALAGTETYDSKFGKFSVSVPDGWKGQAIPDGCAVQTADGNNCITIQFMPVNKNIPLKDAAKMFADGAKITDIKENVDKGAVFLDGKKDGIPAGVLTVETGELFMAVLLLGEKRDVMMDIFKSVKQ